MSAEKEAMEIMVAAATAVIRGEASGLVFVLKEEAVKHKDHDDTGYYIQAVTKGINEFEAVGQLELAKSSILGKIQSSLEGQE